MPELTRARHALDHLAEDVASTERRRPRPALAALGDAQHRFETLGGYAVEAEARRVLAGLGFAPTDADRPLPKLVRRLAHARRLARLLLAQPDVLVLDEPTNHLDVDSVAWLEQHLPRYAGALLFVSHDRDFIDAVAERVLELSPAGRHRVRRWLRRVRRAARGTHRPAARPRPRSQHMQIATIERFVERFRYKATKARQVQSRVKALEKLERIEVPDRKELVGPLRASPSRRRSSRVVAELTGVDGRLRR